MPDAVATSVAIVGGGPVGLSLALGLARFGVRSVLLERKEATSEHSKAPALHVRTREVFRLWGIEDRVREAGVLLPAIALHSPIPGRPPIVTIHFSELGEEVDRPGLLVLEQSHTERLLLQAVRATGLCDVRFGAEAVALAHDPDGVRLAFRQHGEERAVHAAFAAGCDGAGSFVRRALGLPFDGHTYAVRPMLADVRVTGERDRLPWPRTFSGAGGITSAVRLSPGVWRLIRLERGEPAAGEDVPRDEIDERVREVLGAGPFDVVWASRFRIHLRSSPRFRVGRVLLAGDAAHVHSPAGGLGMNSGIHDAHNLAWKLAYALGGGDVERLLESYDVERRSVTVEGVSRYADALTRAFLQTPPRVRGLAFALFRGLMWVGPLRRRQLRRATMIDLGYGESPLLDARDRASGVRLPNPVVVGAGGRAVRLYDLLPGGPVLLDVADRARPVPELPVTDVIRIGAEGYEEPAGVLRRLTDGKDAWVLVRPDAHVAWVRPDLHDAALATRRALGL